MNFDILWSFIKEHVLHNFTKYFSGAWVNQIVNNDLNSESFCVGNLLEMDMLETIDKNVFEIKTLPNNLLPICRF